MANIEHSTSNAEHRSEDLFCITSNAGWILSHFGPSSHEWVRSFRKDQALQLPKAPAELVLAELQKVYGAQLQLTPVDKADFRTT